MPFTPDPKQPDFSKLKMVLLDSGLQKKDNALYQVINSLLSFIGQFQQITTGPINLVTGVKGILPIKHGGTNNNQFASGSVIFAFGTGDGSQFREDNANFFWDDANNRLGIGVGIAPAADLSLPAAGFIGFQGRGFLQYQSDGVLTLWNNAVNNFTRLQLGNTGTGGPSIKKNGANIEIRLADDSAYTQIDYGISGIHGDMFAIADATHDFGAGASVANRLRDFGISRTINWGGATFIPGVISPSALASGNNNDYAPTGFSTTTTIRLTPDAAGSTLTGIAAGVAGRQINLINLGSATITLTHDDANSSAANRFFLRNGASIALGAHASVILWYDTTSSRWRSLAGAY